MAVFLLKTEPDAYSIDDLRDARFGTWDGVRNPAALKCLRSMQPGDRALIYHTGKEKCIAGEAQVTSDPRPDPVDPRSWVIDLKYLTTFETQVTLKEIKDHGAFEDWALCRQPRLSVMTVPDRFLVWFRDRLRQFDEQVI